MTTVAVVSSIYGGYDHPHVPPAQDVDCEWVMVTDQDWAPPPWRVVCEPRPHVDPRLAAKVAKAEPRAYTDAEVTIWADGNLAVTSAGFASWCLAGLGDGWLAQHRNPDRTTIWDEVAAAEKMAKYGGQRLAAQAEHYLLQGFPATFGTWWTGLIVRRSMDCPPFGDAWLAEMCRWTLEDQLSQPFVLWQADELPADLEPDWGAGLPFRLQPHDGAP